VLGILFLSMCVCVCMHDFRLQESVMQLMNNSEFKLLVNLAYGLTGAYARMVKKRWIWGGQ